MNNMISYLNDLKEMIDDYSEGKNGASIEDVRYKLSDYLWNYRYLEIFHHSKSQFYEPLIYAERKIGKDKLYEKNDAVEILPDTKDLLQNSEFLNDYKDDPLYSIVKLNAKLAENFTQKNVKKCLKLDKDLGIISHFMNNPDNVDPLLIKQIDPEILKLASTLGLVSQSPEQPEKSTQPKYYAGARPGYWAGLAAAPVAAAGIYGGRLWWNKRKDEAEAERIRSESDEKIREKLMAKIMDPNTTAAQKQALLDPAFFSAQEIAELSKSAPVNEPNKLNQFYSYISNTPAAAITGGALAVAGLAGIYYLWKKWRDRGKIEAEDIKVANKIDER